MPVMRASRPDDKQKVNVLYYSALFRLFTSFKLNVFWNFISSRTCFDFNRPRLATCYVSSAASKHALDPADMQYQFRHVFACLLTLYVILKR
jgi:hypothetical protein